MSFRRSALVSAVVVLGLSAFAPVSAQPQVPLRPSYGPFGGQSYGSSGIFGTGGGGLFGQQGAFGPGFNNGFGFNNGVGFGNGFNNGFRAPGFVTPGSLTFPQNQPTLFVDPQVAATGVVGRFNYLGHWYGTGSISGGLGHWYPNGVANGRGVLGQGAGYGTTGLYSLGSGMTAGSGTAGSALGTAATAGGALNLMRR